MATSAHRYRLRRILPIGLIWLVFGLVYSIIAKGLLGNHPVYPATGIPYDFGQALLTTTVMSLLMGLVVGASEAYFDGRLYTGLGFPTRILLKALLYTGAVVVFLLVVNTLYLSRVYDVSVLHPSVWRKNLQSLSAGWFWSIIAYIGSIATLSLYFSELQQHLGHNVIGNFFTGRYHRPRQEERIFMFLDMKSSTTLAERMGHERYFAMLNRYYADVTRAISSTSGEIWQYVGDEVVVTWTMADGLRDDDCVRCFFNIRRALDAASAGYTRDFGHTPGTKAGLHCGTVTTGEIGTVRKDIMFTGDVMNTTARIQSLCNAEGVDLLISDDLLKRLALGNGFRSTVIGERELKGKEERVLLHTVRPVEA